MRDTPIARLRFWYAQTVLPLVYDYSLSLYELVCKLADSINQTIDAIDELDDKVDDIQHQIDVLDPTNIEQQLTNINNRIDNIEGDVTNIENQVLNIGDDITSLRETVQGHTNELADHETRISILEGYAFEGITPATKQYVDDAIAAAIAGIKTDDIEDLQDQIDALVGGGYTPVYGSVDFGTGLLLKHDPTEQDPDRMVVASSDFQVSAAYVQALNMVYGCLYISMSEGAEVNAIPADTYVLVWKNSADLPPIAHDFPGIKVQWDTETHKPDLIKLGINYNNAFTKRCDTFFTPNRDNYADYVGAGYRWYSEVYLNNIAVGSPVREWAILQIPFCYLSLKSSGYTETDLYTIGDSPVTQASGAGIVDIHDNLASATNIGSDVCEGWGIEFNANITPNSSGAYRGTFFSAGRTSRGGLIQLNYRSDADNYCRVFETNVGARTIANELEANKTYKLIYLYEDKTLTLYDEYGDVLDQLENLTYVPTTYTEDSVLFGHINDTGGRSQQSYGTINSFRFFKLT